MALYLGYSLLALHLLLWFGLLGRAYRRSVRAIAPLNRHAGKRREWPRVCAIVPARDEAIAIEKALRSLLTQDYPGLHVVCANDGSTDATPAILKRLSREFRGRLTVLNVPEPPPGWMGKTHAQWRAVARAPKDTELYLFTDADVIHERGTLRRAVAHMTKDRADLFAIFPRLDCVGFWESALLPLLVQIGLAAQDMRRVNDPASRVVVGVGAFTMIRRDAYEGWGGHAAIKGEVIDDLALGLKTKRAGGRLCLVRDSRAVHLRMYHGLGDIIRGFEKNAHTAIGGGVLRVAVFAAFFAVLHLLPLATAAFMWFTPGIEAKLVCFLAGCLALVTGETVWERTRFFCRGNGVVTILFYPLGVMAMMAVFVKTAWSGALKGEVVWRGRRLRRPPQQIRGAL